MSIILTFDRDYGELIYRRMLPAPLGIIHLRFEPINPEEAGHRLLDLFGADEITLQTTIQSSIRVKFGSEGCRKPLRQSRQESIIGGLQTFPDKAMLKNNADGRL